MKMFLHLCTEKLLTTKPVILFMLAKVSQVGSSVGVIIPRYIATEGGFAKGAPINIEFKNGQIIISKHKAKREGWAEAFARYAKEGEDEMMLPDELDSEAIELMQELWNDSYAVLDQIKSIDKSRLNGKIGEISEAEKISVSEALKELFDY